MKIGFTGTQAGMTEYQKDQLLLRLQQFEFDEFHHGDCVGADEQAHSIVREHFKHVRIVIHPPSSKVKRAFCTGDSYFTEEGYLARNRTIVDYSDFVIATPRTEQEQSRGGTWYTIRYAKKQIKHVVVINPYRSSLDVKQDETIATKLNNIGRDLDHIIIAGKFIWTYTQMRELGMAKERIQSVIADLTGAE